MYMRVTYLLSDEYVYHKYKVETTGLLLHICLQKVVLQTVNFPVVPRSGELWNIFMIILLVY